MSGNTRKIEGPSHFPYVSVRGTNKRKSLRICALVGGNKDKNEENADAPEKKVYTGTLLVISGKSLNSFFIHLIMIYFSVGSKFIMKLSFMFDTKLNIVYLGRGVWQHAKFV